MPSHFIRYRNTTGLYLGVLGVEFLILFISYTLELQKPETCMVPVVLNSVAAFIVGAHPKHDRCSVCLGKAAAGVIFLAGFIAALSNYGFLTDMEFGALMFLGGSLALVALLLIPLQIVPLLALTERYGQKKGIRPAFGLWPFFFAVSYAVMTGYSWKLSSSQFWYFLGAQVILLILCICDVGVLREKPLKKSPKKK